MSEMYANFEVINEVAQTIMGSFGRVTENYWGETTSPRDPTNMTLEDYKSLSSGLGFKPAEQVLYSLGQAKDLAGADSLGKLGFDTEIQAIIDALKQGNDAIESVGLFLDGLLASFERSEARLMSIYGYYGEVSDEDMRWIEDCLDPMGTSVQQRGLLYALTGDAEWSSLLATGEDGTIGIDACFMDETVSRTHRTKSGKRVTDSHNQRLLCLTFKAGKGEYSGGEKYGLEVSATLTSVGSETNSTGGMSMSQSKGAAFYRNVNRDGTYDDTVALPKIPVAFKFHTAPKGMSPSK